MLLASSQELVALVCLLGLQYATVSQGNVVSPVFSFLSKTKKTTNIYKNTSIFSG